MPSLKLTKKAVRDAKAPSKSGKQTLYWDTELAGFGLLCSGISDSKTFICQRDLPDGRARRVTIGPANVLDLDEARERAKAVLADFLLGRDPKRKTAATPTLRKALDDYLLARKDLRPASVYLYRLAVEKYLTPWLDWPLVQITSDLVEARHRQIAAEINKGGRYAGTTAANLAMRVLRLLWSYTAKRAPGGLPSNPVACLQRQWYAEPRRERLVRADDLAKFHAAVLGLPNPVARDFIILLLFTGLRRGEAASLQWSDIDFNGRLIRVPSARTKSGRRLDLPMTTYVRDLLVARRALGDATFVFPGARAGQHLAQPGNAFAALAAACGVRVSAHDMRRTYCTIAESTDMSPLALKALVNHSLGKNDVTSGYVMMTVERLREPAQKVADRIAQLCGVAPVGGENVAKLG